MSETVRKAKMVFGYSNTDFTRTYNFAGLSAAAITNLKSNVMAVNASLSAGTDNGLADFFRSDDYDASDSENIIGKFTGIVTLQSFVEEEEDINLSE